MNIWEQATIAQLADIANNQSKNIIDTGNGLNPTALQFDLISICSDRLGAIENYDENFNVDVNANNMTTYAVIPSMNSGVCTIDSSNNILTLLNPATGPTLTIEDTNGAVVYSGTWLNNAYNVNFSGGYEHVNNATGAYAEYQFIGTGISYYADTGSDHGKVDVYIDGVKVSTVDGYNVSQQFKQSLYSVTGLMAGLHTIKIVNSGTKNASSTGYIMTLDYFEVLGVTASDIFIRTPIKFLAPGFSLKMTVKNDTLSSGLVKSSARVGLIKDGGNWIFANYNKTNESIEIISLVNGVYNQIATATYEEISAPYELILLVKNNDLVFSINKDNNLKGYISTRITDFNFKDPTVLSQYTLGFGARIGLSESLTISNINSGYDHGMSIGADYKLITYEDGTPLKHDDSYFFTASEHSVDDYTGSGAIVYKVKLNSFSVQQVGVIFSKYSDTVIQGDQTCKVVYDRNQKCFLFLANNFQGSPPSFMIGKTTANLLSGVNIVAVQRLIIDGVDSTNVWDADFIYDKTSRTYKMVYSSIWYLNMAEVADVYDSWITIKTSSIKGEGATFARINGQYYITWSPNPHNAIVALYDFNFNFVTNLTIDKFPSTNSSNGAFPWGFILPAQDGTETAFYLFLFSMRQWNNHIYGYGDCWIYKAKQVETGSEYTENNKLMF